MPGVNTYKDLVVWQKAMKLVIEVYQYTEEFPKSELYGLVMQMRRAAVSIPSNIAEGFRRNHQKERVQFFTIAYGSGAELETQIELAKSLFPSVRYDISLMEQLLVEVMRMLNAMLNH